jgi:nitroimidazol reductase NimA-like FMN-containing flavoprotein (pyridoxamine 5'-phosphate oxidase superfamily)
VAADEQIRAQIMPPRQALDLTENECWQLLASMSLGRIVFTQHALPAIRPVNHLTEDATIIIRSHPGSAITAPAAADGAIVCYEADQIDPVRHTGWSVIATGPARMVTDPAAAARYQNCWNRGQPGRWTTSSPSPRRSSPESA